MGRDRPSRSRSPCGARWRSPPRGPSRACCSASRAGSAPAGRAGRRARGSGLQVRREVLVHLEHGALVLAEDLLQLVVGEDLALVLWVLKVVLLDVVPYLADHLTARQRAGADD